MQPTATHVEALTGNFLDGEFDPPPSPPERDTRGLRVAGESIATRYAQLSARRRNKSGLSTETRSANVDGVEVQYTLQRSVRRRRTIQLQLDPDKGLKLLAPHTLTDAEIDEFLLNHTSWIKAHLHSLENSRPARDWAQGGTSLLRGIEVLVSVEERDVDDIGRDLAPTVVKSLEGDAVTVIIPPGMDAQMKSDVVQNWLTEWYRQEAWDHLKSRVTEFGNVLGVKPSRLKLSNARKRWGSCSGKRSINLNWRLIMLDDRVIDYVVVHELAHLVELNHSAAFWKIVEGVFPDHKELRRRLREHSPSALG